MSGYEERVAKAMEMTRLAASYSERYYGAPLMICYSGGKDSDALIGLAKEAGIRFEVQHSRTTVDAPETMMHVRDVFAGLRAEGVPCRYDDPSYKGERVSMWSLIPQKLMPPTRLVRYCCQILKETGGKGRAISTGVRRDESSSRRKRKFANNFSRRRPCAIDFDDAASLFEDAENAVEHDDDFTRSCRMRGRTSFQPIIGWSSDDVWRYIGERGIEVNPLYSEGFERIGCIGCPFTSKARREADFERWPKYRDAYMRAFARMLEVRRERGLPTDWETPEEVMEWWLSR